MSSFEVCNHEVEAPELPDLGAAVIDGQVVELVPDVVRHWCNSDPGHVGQHHCCCGFRWDEEVPC